MGNTNFSKTYIYNKNEDLNKRHSDYAGPYILPSINNFQKEVVEYYKDKTLIGKVLEKMKEFKDRHCLGRRLKIGDTKEGSPIFEKNLHILHIKKWKIFVIHLPKICMKKKMNLYLKILIEI